MVRLASLLSMCVVFVQHGYYQTTRDHVRRMAEILALGEFGIATTPGMQGAQNRMRLGRVQTVLYLLLSVLALLDLGGIVYELFQ
jgi:hypothetical protein